MALAFQRPWQPPTLFWSRRWPNGFVVVKWPCFISCLQISFFWTRSDGHVPPKGEFPFAEDIGMACLTKNHNNLFVNWEDWRDPNTAWTGTLRKQFWTLLSGLQPTKSMSQDGTRRCFFLCMLCPCLSWHCWFIDRSKLRWMLRHCYIVPGFGPQFVWLCDSGWHLSLLPCFVTL